MISAKNRPREAQVSDRDFTVDAYREVVQLALLSYSQADYRSIPWGTRFILWRHDCDYSLSRALPLGKIEAAEGLRSTFFVNPHCEYYNVLEAGQLRVIRELMDLGHALGLHFDGAFHSTASERRLHEQVQQEAALLEQCVGVRPVAFSFHNPSVFHLTCEEESYGGLVNCYSKRLKRDATYCSDSNGYWRFRRLYDVLNEATAPCLQVLTHPCWWQDRPMPPRQRIFRCVYGRARANMGVYDQGLEHWGRDNLAGAAQSVRFLESFDPAFAQLCDYLWNSELFETLFAELWRFHERQISHLCQEALHRRWSTPAWEVDAFVKREGIHIQPQLMFNAVFGDVWQTASGQSEQVHQNWAGVHRQLVHGCSSMSPTHLEEGCVHVTAVIQAVAAWGRSQAIADDGLGHPGSQHDPSDGTTEVRHSSEQPGGTSHEHSCVSREGWEALKETVLRLAAQQRLAEGLPE